MPPLVSVLTSVYNGENYLKECVDSILGQTFDNFEYVILNDGSTDRTKNILEKYTDSRIRIIHQDNLGIPKSLNKGISLCNTSLIAHLDADDYVQPYWLEKLFKFMENNPGLVFCGSRFEELYNGKLYPQSFPFLEWDDEIRKSLCFMNIVPHSFTIFRKPSFLKVGGYDPNLSIAHDYDLWIRLLKEGQGHNLNEILGVLRIHEASISKIKERILFQEVFQVQWKAYRELGGSFWRMVRAFARGGLAWFLPPRIRSFLRKIIKKR